VQSLLFMADYGADPLWDLASGAMVNVDRLEIGAETRAALRDWAKRWDALASTQMRSDDVEAGMSNSPADPVPTHVWEDLDREGRKLCDHLRQELGPDWRVGWTSFPDSRRHVQWEPNGPVERM
jgi:hypothetical protein